MSFVFAVYAVAALVATLAVVPGLIVYAVSVQFLTRSIESWFDVKVDAALEAITEQVTIRDGDTLEIGVRGFPPARYECVWPKINGVPSWRPAGLKAA